MNGLERAEETGISRVAVPVRVARVFVSFESHLYHEGNGSICLGLLNPLP